MDIKNSYFMRVFYWDDEEDGEAPVYIKVPLSILSPSRNMMALLIALEYFYDVECYLTINDIFEISDEKIGLVPFGIATRETMLVTASLDDGYDERQYLCSITSSTGEYDLLAIDRKGAFVSMMANQQLADYLGLVYIEEATIMHQSYLENIGYGYGAEKEYVYFPTALY